MNRTLSETLLQSRLRNDDKNALETIYKKYRLAFINYASGFDIDNTVAADIYQDSVIAMHQNFVINKLNLEKSSIKTYLFGIGKNKIYKYLKEQKKTTLVNQQVDDYEEICLNENVHSDKAIELSKNLKLISESCQKILKLYYYRGLTIDEIVEQTDYKDSATVRSHKSRCMKRLKTLFKKK